MGCDICTHSYGFEWEPGQPNVQTIHCTLNPVWVEVSSDHFCSQYWNDYAAPKYDAERSARRDELWASREQYKKRAADAERKLKAANKRLREMRAKGGDA